jgi:hypothetical protein
MTATEVLQRRFSPTHTQLPTFIPAYILVFKHPDQNNKRRRFQWVIKPLDLFSVVFLEYLYKTVSVFLIMNP